ncbi:helix-turn-helix domain-containing protein [Paenibacillus macquariensis]|uniref:helix-turn-helix domain-containing protein n=1 Tax=Paenibacillus macquariensis TaxID=948756 RepID=UPI0009EF4AEA|nr:helix-turn-helix transcriptional regulator [Paenibacillus macquariensis]MEC0090227.1 helix-turn-helix transcriptional regulator [Paenibacillus macquariensis]
MHLERVPLHLGDQVVYNYRKGRGYSQEELANLANLHSVYIGQLERGEKSPTIESLEGCFAKYRLPY